MKDKSKKNKDKEGNKKSQRRLRKMIIKIICGLIVLGIIMALTVLGINLYMKHSVAKNIITIEEASDKDADCIIVLGAGVRTDGNPSWMLEDRIIIGEQLYEAGASKKLLMSGDHGREEYDEVNTMKNYAINDGIPSEDIFMDHAGFETYDTMYRAKEVFGAKKVIIVTQKYHMYRALYIAKSMGMEAYGVTSDLRGYSKKQYYREVREWLARVKSFGKCILKSNPRYLGETIDLKASGDVTNDK
ncbi:MAG: vancomycin high temperature exclusion protein [Eubacterium sp.]